MSDVAMPQDVPPCGRVGCVLKAEHRHDEWAAGDRCVIEPKLATAPGFAYSTPRGTVTRGRHASITVEVVTVSLDDGRTVDVDWHLLTRVRTFNQRQSRRRAPAAEKPRKGALDPELYDEPTLGDYMVEQMATRP